MAGWSIITYKGKEISYLDYRGMKLDEIIKTLDEATSKSLKENKPMLLLTNVTGIFAVPEFMDRAKEAGKKTKHLTLKSAIVGISGAKKILLNAFNVFTDGNTKTFDDEESAKEWLVKG